MAEESEAEALVQTCRRCGDSSPVREGFDRRGRCPNCLSMSPKRVHSIAGLIHGVLLLSSQLASCTHFEIEGQSRFEGHWGLPVLVGLFGSTLACWLTAQLHVVFQAIAARLSFARVRFIVFGGVPHLCKRTIGNLVVIIGRVPWFGGGGVVYGYPRVTRDWQLLFVPLMTILIHLVVGIVLMIASQEILQFPARFMLFHLGAWNLVAFLWHAIPHPAFLTDLKMMSEGAELLGLCDETLRKQKFYGFQTRRRSVMSARELKELRDFATAQEGRWDREEGAQRVLDLITVADYDRILADFLDSAVPQTKMDSKQRKMFVHGVPDADQIILDGVVVAHQQVHGEKETLNYLTKLLPEVTDPLRRASLMGNLSWFTITTDSRDLGRALELAQAQFHYFPWRPRARGLLGIALIENGRDAEGRRLLREADQMRTARWDFEGAALRGLWMALSLSKGDANKDFGGAAKQKMVVGTRPRRLLSEAAKDLGAEHPQVLWMRKRIDELTG